jgi:hypothetical protein
MPADACPKVLRRYTKKKRGSAETVLCEQREYAEGDSNGQYQLWVWQGCKYVGTITRQVVQEKREEQQDHQQYSVLAWPDLRHIHPDDNMGPNQTRNIASMLGRLRRETAFDRTEACSFRDYLSGKDDPKVALLQTQLAIANHEIKKLEAQNAELQAKVTLLEFHLSNDPKVIGARRMQRDKEIQDKIDATKAQLRAKEAQEMKDREARERKDPELRKKRERREADDKEYRVRQDEEDKKNGSYNWHHRPW